MRSVHVYKQNHIWKGAFILSIAGIIVKLLSAAYRIPYQNIAGDIGLYIYQQVYPLYGIALILSTFGFPVVISKLIAEQQEKESFEGIKKVLLISFITLLVLSLILFSFIFFGSKMLARGMGDEGLVLPIRIVAFSFLLIPFISIGRGYFQGLHNMIPTAVSQVAEQFVRVTTILTFSFFLIINGEDRYVGGAGALFGSVTGGFAALFILLLFLRPPLNKNKQTQHDSMRTNIKGSTIIGHLLGQGILICISSLVLILLQFIDSITVYKVLILNGFDLEAAKELKGAYDRGQPLLQLGTVIATSFSLAIVPLIASAQTRNDHIFIQEKANLSLRISCVFGFAASLGLLVIIKPTNIMLFTNADASEALMVISIAILFSSISITSAAIMQGLGQSFRAAVHVIIGIFVKLLLNLLLLPFFSIAGSSVATVISFATITFLNMMYLQKCSNIPFLKKREVRVLLFSGLIMGSTLVFYNFFMSHFILERFSISIRFGSSIQAVTSVLLGGVTYLFIIGKKQLFTDQELSYLPQGEKIKWLNSFRITKEKNRGGSI